MDKRYQVFVSSTYADLKNERQKVIQALMEMDCIPSGMELFPAADQEQWEFIKRVIDDCDYYLLIIGGRYGSTTADGISYTEKEFDYAVSKGIKVVALLHENPDEIEFGKSEQDAELRGRLKAFREKASTDRLVKYWKTADQLPGLVSLSLSKTIKTYPAVGWIRADKVSNVEILSELNEVRKENERLKGELSEFKKDSQLDISDLASLDDIVQVYGERQVRKNNGTGFYYVGWKGEISWRSLFALISPFVQSLGDDSAKSAIERAIAGYFGHSSVNLNAQVYQTLKIQLQALGLVRVEYLKTVGGGMRWFWRLTPPGQRLMIELRTVKIDGKPSYLEKAE